MRNAELKAGGRSLRPPFIPHSANPEPPKLSGWARTEIGGKSADVFDPPDSLPFVLIYLHSLAEESPAESEVFTAALARHRLRCVAPRGGRCWWADRACAEFDAALTPERYILGELVSWAESRWSVGSRGIALTGVEMGGQGALRLALKHPQRFPVAASISGALDCQEWYGRGTPLDAMYESAERCRLDTAILHVDSHDWPRHIWFCCSPDDRRAFRGNDRLHEKLAAMGVPHACDLDTRAPAGANYADSMTPPLLEFVAGALEKESRRLM